MFLIVYKREKAVHRLLLVCYSLVSLISCQSPKDDTNSELPFSNERLNIIFVLADDQGYGDMGYYGNEILKTPNMDRLAGESIRLNNFYVNPICAPTRACFMTGRYCQRTGVWDTWKGRTSMHGDEYTIAEALRDSGYATAMFGKWHLGYNTPLRPIDQGFETTVEFEEYAKSEATRIDSVMKINGKLKNCEGFLTDVVFDEAIDWISEKSKEEKPFFAYIPTFLPHGSDKPMVMPEYKAPYEAIDSLDDNTCTVYGMLAKLDEKLGQLLHKVDELGIRENTILIYASDNGPAHYNRFNRGLRGHKTTVFEGGIKVPFFIRWPKKFEGNKEINALTAHIDLLPTLLEICQIPPQRNIEVDGISFLPQLFGKKPDNTRTLFFQFQRAAVPALWKNTAMIKDNFKLVADTLLFDLSNDWGEQNNIINEFPAIAANMRQEVQNWFADVSSTRGYITSPVTIGSSAQTKITLQFWNRNASGWPVKVVNEGLYRVTVQNVEPRLFPEGATLNLEFGEVEYSLSIEEGKEELVYGNLSLNQGDYNFNMWTEGKKAPEKGRWNQENLGYKNVIIEYQGD